MAKTVGGWARLVGTWLLIVIVSVPIFAAGVQKFRSPMWPRMFQRWGYPDHFYLMVGAVEVVAVLGLLWPRTRFIASLTLMAVMAGAFFTHVMHNERRFVETAVIFTLLGIIALVHRPRRSGAQMPADRASGALPVI